MEDNDKESCNICFQEFKRQKIGRPKTCQHCFCLKCIKKWALINKSCPVDRIAFSCLQVYKVFGGEIIENLFIRKKGKKQIFSRTEFSRTEFEVSRRRANTNQYAMEINEELWNDIDDDDVILLQNSDDPELEVRLLEHYSANRNSSENSFETEESFENANDASINPAQNSIISVNNEASAIAESSLTPEPIQDPVNLLDLMLFRQELLFRPSSEVLITTRGVITLREKPVINAAPSISMSIQSSTDSFNEIENVEFPSYSGTSHQHETSENLEPSSSNSSYFEADDDVSVIKTQATDKLKRHKEVENEVSEILKPYFLNKTINKNDYKTILRKAVPKICKEKREEINRKKTKYFVHKYMMKVLHEKRH